MAAQKQRINNLTAGLMVTLALFFDLLSLIPIVNVLTGFLATLIFGLWFYMLGVGFINPKRFATAMIAVVIEVVPFLSMLPGITVAIIATIMMVKSEDKLGIKIPVPGKK